MDKKVLKWYESPVMETVELEVEATLLAGSTNAKGVDTEDDEDGFVDPEAQP